MKRALGLVALAALVAACPDDDSELGNTSGDPSSSQGTQSSSTGQNPPPCGELGDGFTDPECGACAEASCCTELSTCDANAACGELVACRGACMDQACVDQCNADFSAGAQDLATLDACLQGPCQADCPMPTGICDTDFTYGDPTCDECLGQSCCTELTDCLADGNCDACMTMGAGVDCDMDALFTAAVDCFQQSCASACPG